MRKIGLFLLLLFCSIATFAQNDVKVRFGLQGGFNMSKWSGDYQDLYGTKFRMGGNFGGVAEIQINPLWSVQPEILLSMEGTKTSGTIIGFCQEAEFERAADDKYQTEDLIFEVPDDVSAWFIKVPIYVMYNFQVGPGRLSPALGIYVAWAFTGDSGSEGTFSDNSYYRRVNNILKEDYNNNPQYYSEEDVKNMELWDKSVPRRFDYGIGVKAIYEMEQKVPGLFASVGATEGLTGAYNLNLQFSLGYKFKYNKWLRKAYNTGILEYNPTGAE